MVDPVVTNVLEKGSDNIYIVDLFICAIYIYLLRYPFITRQQYLLVINGSVDIVPLY